MKRLRVVGCSLFLLCLVACTGAPKVGMAKSEVIERLGRPRNWARALPDGRFTVATVYSVESLKGPMPAGEIWLLEYVRSDGAPYCLYLRNNAVIEIVEGPLLKDRDIKSRAP